jgi:F-type H+-transporting ATPase subunit gamma
MAKTRAIRKRITSVRNIHKITHTMERVAQSKAMKLANRFELAKAFRSHLLRLLPETLGAAVGTVEATQELVATPLCALRAETRRVLLFCVTSSRGLCGSYNTRVIHAARARMQELAREEKQSSLAVMGKKGLAYFRFHNQPVLIQVPEADEHIPFARIDEAAEQIIALFLAREVDAVEIVSTRQRTRMTQEVRRAPLMPFAFSAEAPLAGAPAPLAGAEAPSMDSEGKPVYLVEPGRAEVLAALAPLALKAELFCAVLEAMLCEQGQRTVAMRSASDNAQSMTKRLTRTYNLARQSQITNEMIEIISGSEGGRT